jgi:sialate O-acetylesterase
LRGTPLFVDQQWKIADEVENCDIVCTTDIGDYSLIHPAAKDKVGQRLAYLALTNDYGIEGLPAKYPRFKSFEKKGNKLVLSFSNMTHANNFEVSDPTQQDCFNARERAKGFEVAGADKKFYPAQANHMWCKNTIEVWSDSVPEPVAVRYAFRNVCGEVNLKNLFGVPAIPFRTDRWNDVK